MTRRNLTRKTLHPLSREKRVQNGRTSKACGQQAEMVRGQDLHGMGQVNETRENNETDN